QYEEEKQARERRHYQQINNLRTFQNQETPLKLVPQKLAFNKHGRSHSAPGSQRFQQNLATAHELPLDTSVYNSDDELGQSPTSSRLDELYPPRNITSILLSDSFWQSIKSLHSLLHPYCEALNKLQSDTARLHEVLQAFGGILK
ncbi:13831_t:CDS:2, partial [Gigaspora rosea]